MALLIYDGTEKRKLDNILDTCDMMLFGIWYMEKVKNVYAYGESGIDYAYDMAEALYKQFEKRLFDASLISEENWTVIKEQYINLKDNLYTMEEYLDQVYIFSTKCIHRLSLHLQRPDERIHLIQKYVWKHYMENISLEEIAKEVNLTSTYLCDLYKRKTGNTIIQYINTYRIERAKEMLSDTDLKMNEIAPLIGYEDEKYFSRVFKKYAGVSPANYRKDRK